MDSKFYMDNFERLLKEKSDEFRMYPTRRVWRSIYNNIYPGRKFPSALISILFITMLPLIGLLNTKTTATTGNIALLSGNKIFITEVSQSASIKIAANTIAFVSSVELHKTNVRNIVAIIESTKEDKEKNINYNAANQRLNRFSLNNSAPKTSVSLTAKPDLTTNATPPVLEDDRNVHVINNNTIEKNIAAANYALQNSQTSQKWTDKLALQIYASPSIIYGVSAGPQTNVPSIEGNNMQNVGLEAGTAMQYPLSNILKIKAGLQFNYASYDIAANQPGHAPLISNDPATTNMNILARASDFSSTASAITLHNEMYQFSMPVGLEVKLLKHNNLQWNAGATIQPTYIAGGDAYLLSSNNHVDESVLINRWNLNAGFETFITYKVNNITWQLGPQFRYQFSSTYGKTYSGVDEKLAVFGVKIGVVKVLH